MPPKNPRDKSHLKPVPDDVAKQFEVERPEPQTKPPEQRHPRLNRAEKRKLILDMRAAGMEPQRIAEEMKKRGYRMTESGVNNAISQHLSRLADAAQEDVRQIRQMDLHRLDKLMQVLWPKVMKGDVRAIREYRMVIDQRSRMLGTYAPERHEHTGRIENIISQEDREEIARLEEAFASARPMDQVIDAQVVTEEDEVAKILEPGD